jgi:replicative DNA helicase
VVLADDTRVASPDYDRTPPQDVPAEQSVLGGMLLSKDAIADVIEALRPTDFYRPAHQLIYDAVLDLYARGEPADAVTVSAELTRAGQLARIGGAAYLHTLIATVPTAANAGYYAQIVAEKAILRRLVTAGTRIVQMGYQTAAGSGDLIGSVDDVVDRAQAEVYDVTERRTSDDYVHIESLLTGTLTEIERIADSGGVGTGIPTGFTRLDEITNGLHPGQMITVAGRPGSGKALALDTPLPTPTGWTTIGAVQVGDALVGADGRSTRVVAATDVMHGRPCYEVEFSDGTVIVADADHQWRTTTRAERRANPRPPTWAHTEARRQRATAYANKAAAEADQDVTIREAVSDLGEELRHVVQKVAWRQGPRGSAFRRVSGPMRSYRWRTPVYSRHEPSAAIAAHVNRSVNSWRRAPASGTVTTQEIAASLRCASDERLNHAVPCAAALALPDADLLIPPYTLGCWLGDGSSDSATLTCADEQIVEIIRAEGIEVRPTGARLRYRLRLPESTVTARRCEVCGASFLPATPSVRTCGRACGGKVRAYATAPPLPTCPDCGGRVSGWRRCRGCHSERGTVQARLRTLGLLRNKHVPLTYLRASEAQRRGLLAGLLDTDGHATALGSVEFYSTNRRLAHDVRELVVSLGYRATLRTKQVRGRSAASSTCYTVAFTSADRVFGLDRKAERQRETVRSNTRLRYIIDVRPVPSIPVRCVQVDNHDHMYLAGATMIPTHNSTLALDFARSAAIKYRKPTVLFSLEMGKLELMMRLLSAEALVPLRNMRSGHMADQDWARLARRAGDLAEAPLFLDDSPNLTMMEIRAKARRLRQRHDLQLIVIDYLQLMTSGKRVESRQQEVSEFSRAIKLLAKELDVPVVALSQLNRGPEQRTDKRPMLADLRESGSIEQDSDVVLLVHREDMYERESPRAGEADLIIAKHRNGPTATVAVSFQGHYSRFSDMPD